MNPTTYKRIYLAERPTGNVTPSTFKEEVLSFDLKPGAGQILVQVTYISLDPAMRGWLREARSYLPPVKIGETMRAGALAIVREAGEGSRFNPGDLIYGTIGKPPCNPAPWSLEQCIVDFSQDGLNMLSYLTKQPPKSSMITARMQILLDDSFSCIISVPPGAQPLDFLNTLGMPGMHLILLFGILSLKIPCA
jgi:hypothetical protein